MGRVIADEQFPVAPNSIVKVLEEKGEVFKKAEEPEIDDATDYQPAFSQLLLPTLGHFPCNHPVCKRHTDQEQQINGTGPGVKNQ